jgi:hypothetical protein
MTRQRGRDDGPAVLETTWHTLGAVGGTIATTGTAHAATMDQCLGALSYGDFVHDMYISTTGSEQRFWMREAMVSNTWMSRYCHEPSRARPRSLVGSAASDRGGDGCATIGRCASSSPDIGSTTSG